MSDRIIIPSTAGGDKHWQVGVMRFNNGRIRAYATEVDVYRNAEGRIIGVGYTVFEARQRHEDLTAKRLTAKVRAEGVAAMVARLEAEGLTPPKTA